MSTALLCAAAIAWMPGDGIVSVELSVFPQACHVVLVDEGVTIQASGYGPSAWPLFLEARLMVQDVSPPPGTITPIQACSAEAKRSCGAAGVKRVKVTTNPDSCEWECYPPPVGTNPPANPPPATGPTP